MTYRTCSADGCEREHRAKGLCSTHYNQALPDRHRKVTVPCAGCATPVEKYRSGTRRPVCSDECKYLVRYGRPHPRTVKTLVHVPRVPPVRVVTAPLTVIPSGARPYWAGQCGWCERGMVMDGSLTGVPPRWCSRYCARKGHDSTRRAREVGATGSYTWAEVMRVYVALGKVCTYCRLPVEGQPDPDHVVPLSRGGRNSITNIVPCCRMCNSDKCDRSIDEWTAWRAERGKQPLPIDLTHPALRYLVIDEATPRLAA